MKATRTLYCCLMLVLISQLAPAQNTCPPNIDYEQGSFAGWECATATNNGNGSPVWTPVAAIANRHTITSGGAVDPYGNFPVVAPGGGMYSVKLGNNATGAQMERLRYTFQVPVSANNFNLIYRYAVVLNDGGHPANQQPYFEVKVTDSANNTVIPCNNSTYVSNSNLPGFTQVPGSPAIWYKPWTAASMRLAGLAGRTLYIEFVTADCSVGGHFGYGYVDLNCGGYAVTSANCNGSLSTPLIGPPGFMQYEWYDNLYNSIGTGQTVYVPSPSSSNSYNVVLTPYPGYGCIDTLTTTIVYSTLAVSASPDTGYLCGTGFVQMQASQVGSSPPYTYSWAPVTGLNCINCANPQASPTVNTAYAVAVTDAVGCVLTDTVVVFADMIITTTHQDATCYGLLNGSASAVPTGGRPPYTYSWSAAPGFNGPILNGIGAGNYNVTVLDANNCAKTFSIRIAEPPLLTASGTATNTTCSGGSNGTVSALAAGGTAPYSYSWNTTPVSTTPALSNLPAGNYTCTITDAHSCTVNITKTIAQPPALAVHANMAQKPCSGETGGILVAVATGGTGTLTYRWLNPYVVNDTLTNVPAGRYSIQVYDALGCMVTDSFLLTSFPLPNISAGADAEICRGANATLNASGGGISYSWALPAYLSCTACTQTVSTPDTTITYVLTGTDANGCRNRDTVTVSVIQRVPVSVDTLRRICPHERILLGATGGESYEWTPAGTLTGTGLPNPEAAPEGTTRYRVIITENRCFKDTLYQTVVVMPQPSIMLGESFAAIPGATVKLETEVTDAASIAWYPPAGLSCTDCYAPTATLDSTITYIAEVTNSYGCKARDTITIRVACDGNAFYVANAFTPNGDGQNDYFYPQGLGVNFVKRMMIYDRWGEVVFSATDIPANTPERGWNGTFRGKDLASDVFLYVVETLCKNGDPIVLKGDITLVR